MIIRCIRTLLFLSFTKMRRIIDFASEFNEADRNKANKSLL